MSNAPRSRVVKRGRIGRRTGLAAGAGLLAIVLLGITIAGPDGEETPASPAVLAHIAAKNRAAAIDAAARFKAESKATTRAADARLRAAEADIAEAPPALN